MRSWLKTSVNSSPFPWIAGNAWVAFSSEYRRFMWDATMASEGCLVGIQRERRDLLGSKVMWEGGKKRCLWSLSKWGAFARLGRGGENEWEASCEADRHTCRWIIWQPGQVLHHWKIHVHHLQLPRCKSVDSIQPLVLLERTKADLKCCFKDKTGSPVMALLCFQKLLWDASWEWLVQLSHSRQHMSAGLCANWHREHWGAPRRAAVRGKMIRYIAVRAFVIGETAQITGTNRLQTTRQELQATNYYLFKVILCNIIWSQGRWYSCIF